MASRNVDKGREAENAVAAFLSLHGFPHVERRTKRGGYVDLDGVLVPADAGDLTGIPGVVVQVKWSPYKPLEHDLRRTEEQRRVGRADVGLLVRKRKGVGLARAGEWDAYLPEWALAYLLTGTSYAEPANPTQHGIPSPWHTDLATAAALIRRAGYGARTPELETVR